MSANQQPLNPLIAEPTSEAGFVESCLDNALAHWTDLGTVPISAAAPAGQNVRLEDSFEQIEQELAKLEAINAQESVDWLKIARWCEALLQHESKDLLVACYLTRALAQRQLLEGLLAGLLVLEGIIAQHWEDCFPSKQRYRGRVAAFDWLVEKSLPALKSFEASVEHADLLTRLQQQVIKVEQQLQSHLAEKAPDISELSQQLDNKKTRLEQQRLAQQCDDSAGAQHKPSVSAVKAAPSLVGVTNQTALEPLANEAGFRSGLRQVQENTRVLCDYLYQQNLADPQPYRLNRSLIWLGISELPTHSDKITQLRPPPKEKLQHYQALIQTDKAAELIPQLEVSLSKAPYWLTGHRWVYEALQQQAMSLAAEAVFTGVKAFVALFPEVVDMQFSDQTPFADEATLSWLTRESQISAPQKADCQIPLKADAENEWNQAYQQAMALAAEEQFEQALGLFQQGCRQSFSAREQLLWRFTQARFCFATQKLKLAIALLEPLLKTLDEKQLFDWEPAITASVVELLLRAYRQLPDSEAPRQRVTDLHERLCQFDLMTAYSLADF